MIRREEAIDSPHRVDLGPVHRVTASPYNFEPHVAVDPTDSDHLAAIAIRASKLDCRFRPRGECLIDLYLAETWDGGASWEELRLTDGFAFDGQVAFGPDGTLLATGLQVPAIFVHRGGVREGVTRANHRLVEREVPSDKPWLTIDSASGDLYLAYSRAADLVLRTSKDRGETWSAPTVVAKGPELFDAGRQVEVPPWGGQVMPGPPGRLAVSWLWSPGMGMNLRLEGQVWYTTSSDGGSSLSPPRLLGRSRGAPSAVSFNGTYYVVYPAGTLDAQQLLIAISGDGGQTWETRVASGDLVLHAALHPAPGVGVSPDGMLDVVFTNPTTANCFDLDARNRVYLEKQGGEWVDTCIYDVFYTCSKDGGRTWRQPIRLNEETIDGRGFVRKQGLSRPGEYLGMASSSHWADPIWIEGAHAYTRRVRR